MSQSFERSWEVPTSPQEVFETWIDGAGHEAMTGSAASSEPHVGGSFTAWDGYITGTWTELIPGKRIACRWRTRQFPDDAADSQVTIDLSPTADGCRVVLRHEGIPDGQPDYDQGWLDHYQTPGRRHWVTP